MTAEQFRKLALGFAETIEASHVGHPDFRVNGRIFATLGYPSKRFGVVNLTPEQQQKAIARYPQVFTPAAGAWGRKGSTTVLLEAANEKLLRPWIEQAWKQIAAKSRRKARRSATR